MELTQVDWRQINVGTTYIHYNGYHRDPGPHIVVVTSIWYPQGINYAFIYTNNDAAYYVSDENTDLTVNNSFYTYVEGPHIRPSNLGDAGLSGIVCMLSAVANDDMTDPESPNDSGAPVNSEDVYENP